MVKRIKRRGKKVVPPIANQITVSCSMWLAPVVSSKKIIAGLEAYFRAKDDGDTPSELVRQLYVAMERASDE